MSNIYTLQESTLQGLGNAMRKHFDTTDTFTPLEMIEKLNEREDSEILMSIDNGEHFDPITGNWVRPTQWPDLDALAAQIQEDEDCVYFTYDLSLHPDYRWIGMYAEMSSGDEWYLDRYDEGNFVHTHLSSAKSDYIRYDLSQEPDDNDIQIWRLTSNGHISKFGFACQTTNSTLNFNNNCQLCVERAGTLPWCVRIGGGIGNAHNSQCGATVWLERDALAFGKNVTVTDLNSIWKNARRLKELDVSQWDTSNWEVTNLSSVWQGCYSLKNLKISNLDTHNWVVTNLSNTWDACLSLEELNLNNWDTSNWEVTTLQSTWQWCASLRDLNISSWNTSNWAVTTLSSTWYYCISLRQLDLNTWDTSNWIVNNMNIAWQYCYNLLKLEINNWNTQNWAISSLSSVWKECQRLKKLNLNNWDTSNWTVTNLGGAWEDCHSLQELNIDQWDTHNWLLSNLTNAWADCYSLKKLNLNNWDTSNWPLSRIEGAWNGNKSLVELNINEWDTTNWTLTSLNSVWYTCTSLKELNLNNWDTSNWNISEFRSTWSNCWALQKLDINEWDTSGWHVTSLGEIWASCYSLKVLDIGDWDTSNWNNTYNNSSSFFYLYSLQICRLPASIPTNKNLGVPNNCPLLTYYSGYNIAYNHTMNFANLTSDSLRMIFNRLPTVTSRTITIGSENKLKLTAEDIAVATNKGWTVA